MKIYKHTFLCKNMIAPINTSWDFYPYNEYSVYDMCFFDIETTGLSAGASSIYLIGAGVYVGDSFEVTQWFADDYDSEKIIIESFFEFAEKYKILFQYNGYSFDIPYIRQKCKTHNIKSTFFNQIKSIDLYTSLRQYGTMLGLPDKKLKSFEQYVGLHRDDRFNGGELISVYSEYMQNKYLHKDNEDQLHLLLLHNYEDITGLSQIASLMFLKELNKLTVSPINARLYSDYLHIEYSCNLPGDYSFELNIPCSCNDINYNLHLQWTKGKILLNIPVITTTLRYYFTDYKDYYYMINEDKVIHKSVAIYTDASVRRKAKKAECFVSKKGRYIPVTKPGCYSAHTKIFREEYTSKEYFIEYDDSYISDNAWLIAYYNNI